MSIAISGDPSSGGFIATFEEDERAL